MKMPQFNVDAAFQEIGKLADEGLITGKDFNNAACMLMYGWMDAWQIA